MAMEKSDAEEGEEIRVIVRDRYGKIAREGDCFEEKGSCCRPAGGGGAESLSEVLGYSAEELKQLPEGADLGLGCGAPLLAAKIEKGMTVLDLGSGAGIDVFLAARLVGEAGFAIGVDMTSEMVVRARKSARDNGIKNAEFRLGEIEHLPVADSSVDLVISNCVVNLSPEKEKVFAEAYRVLRPGGQMVLSDIVARYAFPDKIRGDIDLYCGCMAGAQTAHALEAMMQKAGFEGGRIDPREKVRRAIDSWAPCEEISDRIYSALISAKKPDKSL